MRRKLTTLVFVTLLISAAALAQAAAAPAAAAPAPPASAPSGPPPVKVGIINIQQAIVSTNEGQRDFQALQKKFEPKKTELEAGTKEVDSMKSQLSAQGDKLNEQARAELIRNIDAKQKSLQRSMEDAQGDFQAQQNDIANRIGQKLLDVLEKYAAENGYAMILDVSSPQSPVLWASSATNVTKPVIDLYNAQSNVAAPTGSGPAVKPTGPAPKPAASTAPKPAAPAAAKPAGSTPAKPK